MQTVMLTVVLCKCRCIHTFTGFLVQFCSGVYGWVVKTEETIRTSLSQRGAKVSSVMQVHQTVQKIQIFAAEACSVVHPRAGKSPNGNYFI